MRRTRHIPFLLPLGLALSVVVAGCATGGSGGGNVIRKDLGKVMVGPLTSAREKVFGKHTIPMYREEDSARTILWESQWIPREAEPEESALGATAGRNRILIRGNYVEERMDGTVVLRVRFEVENQIQTDLNR